VLALPSRCRAGRRGRARPPVAHWRRRV